MITDEPHIMIDAQLIRKSAKAFLLRRSSDNEEFWVPQSQVQWEGPNRWAISKWFADKEGIDE